MKSLKFWFVLVLTLITVLAVFLIADALFAGIVYLIILIWDKVLAASVFKWVVIVMFALQVALSIPFTIKGIREGDDESGT